MMGIVLSACMFGLTLCIAAMLYRMFHSESSMADRVLLLDSLSFVLIGIVAILSIWLDTTAFFEAILLIGILAFTSTIALSRFIERGVVIVRDRDRH
jgi:multicomponent Na+:H+ antiporter subunit F